MNLELRIPVVYPPLQEIVVEENGAFVNQYKLFENISHFAGQEVICGSL